VLGSYAYDPLSHRTGLTRGNGAATSFGYDANDLMLTSLGHTLPAGASANNLALGFGYTNANQLSSRTVSNGAMTG